MQSVSIFVTYKLGTRTGIYDHC